MDNEIPFHEMANIFPLVEGAAFRDLVEDIRVNGLRDAIVLHNGAILDGRNRYRACRAAQVATRFRTYDGRDPLGFVVSSNLHRRHLDASQRSMIAAQIAVVRQAGGRQPKDGKPAAVSAGNLLNVSGSSVRMAQRVLKNGVPQLVESVRSGNAAVSTAAEIARLPKAQQTKLLRSDGISEVASIGRNIRSSRLSERRVRRASDGASAVAIFDHIKIGDGRAIGNVRFGEIKALARSLRTVVDVLFAISERFASADHSCAIRDAISEKTFSEMVARFASERGAS